MATQWVPISQELVMPGLQDVVVAAFRVASRELELEPFTFTWVLPARLYHGPTDRFTKNCGCNGWTEVEHRAVYLSPFIDYPVMAAFHESRHLWQHAHQWPLVGSHEPGAGPAELDAWDWAGSFLPRTGLHEYAPRARRMVIEPCSK